MPVRQTHHGWCVADLDAARSALRAIGFTRVQPGAPDPLVYEDRLDDPVGRRTCGDLGSPYRTHYVEHPGTGQQIDLIEIAAHARLSRPAERPLEGDLTVVVPCDDPDTARSLLGPLTGGRFQFVDGGEPWATVHYTPEGWSRSRPFYEQVLGVRVEPLGTPGRWALAGIGGRIEVDVDHATPRPPAGGGKRYHGANHFRIVGVDLDAVAGRVSASAVPGCRWALPPEGGFGFVVGPSNETIELFDRRLA
jgi:hypothetical protein